MQSRELTRGGVGYEAERGSSGTARGRGANKGEAGKQNGKSSKPMGMGGHDEQVKVAKAGVKRQCRLCLSRLKTYEERDARQITNEK